jgi:enoyl-CoA hydratase
MADESEIIFAIKNGTGIITLNRPQALNALTLGMIREMNQKLGAWAEDSAIHAVIIRGAGGRAFCSGGDVKSVALDARALREGKSDGALARDFFREEYTLNHRIYTFPKPYIALIDGIVMGGGKGVSAHGSHRVVTENTLFAMPETNIGFFPDVGGGYFLPRCPGQTGVYLALTATRIKAADTLYIGFATHFVPAAKIAALTEALTEMRWDSRKTPAQQVDMALEDFSAPAPDSSEIAPHRQKIDACFSADRLEDIVASLQKDKSPWAEVTLAALYAMSPTSLKIALRQIRLGAKMPFAGVMAMEYRLSQACVQSHDFYEGIRAALIDKDRQPKWRPARIEDVPDSVIESYFQSLGERELVL